MSRTLQIKRGNASANDGYTGKEGEITLNMDDYSIRIHDGVTQGGHTISASGGSWGEIGGTLADQTDLQNALNSIDNIFIAVPESTTYEEVAEAFDAKKVIFAVDGVSLYQLVDRTASLGRSGGTELPLYTFVRIFVNESGNFAYNQITLGEYGWTTDFEEIALAESTHTHNYVPTSRTVNNKALTSNITLTASDIGALSSSTTVPVVTDTYSGTSSEAMSGKAVASAISGKADSSSLSSVATSGSYNDLDDTPSIPTVTDTYTADGTDAVSGKAVASAVSGKADSATTLSGYGITDAYTKDEIDSIVNSVYVYKGSVANVDALPTTDLTIGFVYNTEDTGMNYAWSGSSWDALGTTVDLTDYPTFADLVDIDCGDLDDTTGGASVKVSEALEELNTAIETAQGLTGDLAIPVVTDTYSETGTDAVSGKAVASALEGYQKTATHTQNYTPASSSWTYTVPTTLDAPLSICCDSTAITSFTVTSADGVKIPDLDNEIVIQFKASDSGCQFSTISGTRLLNEVNIQNGANIAVSIYHGIIGIKSMTTYTA